MPYILDEFKYYFETPFSPTKDNFYQCDVHRPSANTSAPSPASVERKRVIVTSPYGVPMTWSTTRRGKGLGGRRRWSPVIGSIDAIRPRVVA